MTKPKPKPAKPATPETPATPPPQCSEQQQQGGVDANADPNANAGAHETAGAASGEVPPASGEPMETDKSETASGAV